jgi:hypothetical protein
MNSQTVSHHSGSNVRGKSVRLQLLDGSYCISRLAGDDPLPAWADGAGFVTISRIDDELSIVCRSERVPGNVHTDPDWVCLKFLGPFAFDETGIVLSVIQPLSEAGLGIFLVSTFDGDCLLLKRGDFARAAEILSTVGHTLVRDSAG